MSNKSIGGYVIVDATGFDPSEESAQTVPGIYEQITNAISSKKPILVVNLGNDTVTISPTPATAFWTQELIMLEISQDSFSIGADDTVAKLL